MSLGISTALTPPPPQAIPLSGCTRRRRDTPADRFIPRRCLITVAVRWSAFVGGGFTSG